MSWGNKLVIVFVVFAGLIGTLVYNCTKQNFELVSKDYYNDELKYQEKIDGANNANKLTTVALSQSPAEVTIQLPKELNGLAVNGEAWFYCVTNSKNDRRLPMLVDEEGMMVIDKAKLATARYLVKLQWKVGNHDYYNEQTIRVQ